MSNANEPVPIFTSLALNLPIPMAFHPLQPPTSMSVTGSSLSLSPSLLLTNKNLLSFQPSPPTWVCTHNPPSLPVPLSTRDPLSYCIFSLFLILNVQSQQTLFIPSGKMNPPPVADALGALSTSPQFSLLALSRSNVRLPSPLPFHLSTLSSCQSPRSPCTWQAKCLASNASSAPEVQPSPKDWWELEDKFPSPLATHGQ